VESFVGFGNREGARKLLGRLPTQGLVRPTRAVAITPVGQYAGGAVEGWLFGIDRYGCSSDRGGWSIYCEKDSEIAVVALRQPDDREKYAACLTQIHEAPITDLLEAGDTAPIQFERMIASWRRGLTMHYSVNRT
jgi:hypothetical protein